MALIGKEKFTQNVLKVKGGGEHPTLIEAGDQRWMIEFKNSNRLAIYNNVVEQLAAQGYRLVSVNEEETTLQLNDLEAIEDAGVTATYIVNDLGRITTPINIFDSHGLSDVPLYAQDKILELLRSGQKIQAIVIVRETVPRLTLKEAKESIDGLAKAVGFANPSGSSCVGMLLIFCSNAGFLGALLYHYVI